jgi:hypothetical protein
MHTTHTLLVLCASWSEQVDGRSCRLHPYATSRRCHVLAGAASQHCWAALQLQHGCWFCGHKLQQPVLSQLAA